MSTFHIYFLIVGHNRVINSSENIFRAYLTIMELLGDTVIVLASQIVFFLVGWIFFVKMLFRDYELHHMLGNSEEYFDKYWI